MSFKISLVKTAIRCTPNKMITWVANIILKGIAELTDFSFDLDARKVHLKSKLYGEEEIIEVWVDGFSIVTDEGSFHFIIQKAESNRPWLNNLLSRIIGKPWKIPVMPKYKAQIEFVAELFKAESPTQETAD